MEFKIEKPYPLYRLVQEEVPSRHHDYIDKNTTYEVAVKIHPDAKWYQLYTTFSEDWAKLALKRLRDIFDVHINRWIMTGEEPVMFEVNDQIYKTKYVFPDHSCICGDEIAGNQRYGMFYVDGVKYDYVQSIIFFYYKDECLLKCNQLFLNGELIMNSKKLDEVCEEVGQDKSLLDSSPDKLLKYIANNYENVKTFSCEGYSSFNVQQYK